MPSQALHRTAMLPVRAQPLDRSCLQARCRTLLYSLTGAVLLSAYWPGDGRADAPSGGHKTSGLGGFRISESRSFASSNQARRPASRMGNGMGKGVWRASLKCQPKKLNWPTSRRPSSCPPHARVLFSSSLRLYLHPNSCEFFP